MAPNPQKRSLLWKACTVLGVDPSSASEARVWAEHAISTHLRLLKELEAAKNESGPRRRKAQESLLRSEESRVASTLRALAKRRRSATREEVILLANSIRPWRDCGEPIMAVPETRKDGGLRWTVSYGVKRLALSYLCADILKAVWGTNQHEYNCSGRGADAAVQSVLTGMESAEDWLISGDVAQFYPSFRQEGLMSWLPLPDAVIRNSVLIPLGAVIILPAWLPMEARLSTLTQIRRGLPMGSPASVLIGSKVMGDVVGEFAFLHRVGHFADNVFGTMCWSDEAVATLKALEARFAAHPLGPFKLKDQVCRRSDAGMEMLGYFVKTVPGLDTYMARAFPTADCMNRYLDGLGTKLLDPACADPEEAAFKSASHWVRGRTSWKPSAKKIDAFLDRALKVASGVKYKSQPAPSTPATIPGGGISAPGP